MASNEWHFTKQTTDIHNIYIDKYHFVVYNNGMKEKKHYIDVVLERERLRNEKMRLSYQQRISELPRGSLSIRELNGRKYCYLRYRDGKRVIQKYAGTIEQEAVIQAQLRERTHLEELIAMLDEENKRILKMEVIE